MDINELKSYPGLVAWIEEGQSKGFTTALSDFIDDQIGGTAYMNVEPHHVHVNFGIQDAVRRVRGFLKDPLGKRIETQKLPPPKYGVRADSTE